MIRLKKSWDTLLGQQIICAECDQPCPRTGPTQRYCEACADRRAIACKAKWYEANGSKPRPREAVRQTQVRKRSGLMEAGRAISVGERWSLDMVFPDEADFAWVRRFEVPFTYAFSKNHSASIAAEGHRFLRKETCGAREAVTNIVRLAIQGADVLPGKLYLDILVLKPNHYGDAINVLDHLSDAIKIAVGLDDRWFCVARIDWQIIKVDPVILIGIGQKHTEPVHVCAYCGRLLPYDRFHVRKRSKTGIDRQCKDCTSHRKRPSRSKQKQESQQNIILEDIPVRTIERIDQP